MRALFVCGPVLLCAFANAQTVSFQPHVDYAAPSGYNVSLAVADMNQDSIPDVVLVRGSTLQYNIAVFLANGDGSLRPAIINTVDGADFDAMTLADFNGDGRPDLVVGYSVTTGLQLLLGNSDGTFQSPIPINTTEQTDSMAAADMNNDGKMDLVTIEHHQGVEVRLGDGNGGFSAPIIAGLGNHISQFFAADLNGDGKIDLALPGEIVLGNGDGTLRIPPVSFPVLLYPVAIADFNRDGKADIAGITDTTGSAITVLLGNGDGTFRVATGTFGGGFVDSPAAVADFDQDGNLDIAGTNSSGNAVMVLRGNGDGSFQPGQTFATAAGPSSIVAGDFNRDGKPDVATGNSSSSVSVLLNSSSALPDIAMSATVAVSSENVATGQLGTKAVDGAKTGYPFDFSKEWATNGELNGAWIQLGWSAMATASKIVLYDRPNLTDNVLAGRLDFSDGSSLTVGQLPNDGTGYVITFSPKNIAWVRFTVTNATGSAIGLSEFEVFGTVGTIANVAPQAQVSVSSENTGTGQLGIKAIDGIAAGYPGDYTKEWATVGQTTGAWIQLAWNAPVTGNSIILFDRPNLTDNVLSGRLDFSDGSSITIGQLPNDGTGFAVNFATKSFTWVRFTVTNAAGFNIGLSEMQVFGVVGVGTALDLALSAHVTVSSENTATGQLGTKAIDGIKQGYPTDATKEWATNGQLGGATLTLTWDTPVTMNQIVLYDRPNLDDNILAGRIFIYWADGASTDLQVPQLPNDGSPLTLNLLGSISVRSLEVLIDNAVGYSTGLMEIECFNK